MNHELNKQLYGLLNETNLTSQKAALVSSYTNGRSESTKDLYDSEALLLIKYLRSQLLHKDKGLKMRRNIISMAIEMHWKKPGSDPDGMKKIDDWCIKFGQFKKPLNKHTFAELPALVTQFKNVYNSFINKI